MPVYRARVTRVGPSGVHVVIPDIGGIKHEFGPLKAIGTPFSVGDECVVGGVGDVRDDVILLASQAGVTMALDDLSDVVITTPAADELLTYNGSEWINAALEVELEDLTDVDLTSPAAGHVLQHNGSGQWVNSATLDMIGSAATTDSITARVSGDTQKRLIVNADGKMEWGSGSATQDTNLYRNAASQLATDDSILLTDGTAQVNVGDSGSTGSFTAKRAASNSVVLSGRVTTDTVNRMQITADGTNSWGSGSGSVDTNLYRGAADLLQTDDVFRAYRSAASDIALAATVSADSVNRYSVQADGKTEWGSGSATRDTNLYRSAANVLKTDDELIVVGDVTAAKGRFGGTSGDAVFIGNDGKLVDVGVTDAIGVQGQSDAANGVLVFGSGGDTNLYRSAANTLKTDDTFIAANIIAGDSGWTTPTLAGSWVNFGGTHQTARYRKHPTGVVEIQGLVKSGSGTIFTLNSGYRPGSILIFACIGDNVEARVDVNPDGTVVLSVGTSGFLSINMSFYVG